MKCLICEEHSDTPISDPQHNTALWKCINCGQFKITGEAKSELDAIPAGDQVKRSVLSHVVKKMQTGETPLLTVNLLKKIVEKKPPTAPEQCDNFILWLGDNLDFAGATIPIRSETCRAILGAVNKYAFNQVIQHLKKQNLIEFESDQNKNGTLTVEGWDYYKKLRQNNPQSRTAFMAMQFDNQELERLVKDVFKPAIAKTGFELFGLNDKDKQRAGLIDDRLRVEIRNARFLIADLTDENSGAYWEAGFAEGLGKPVIYICEKEKFDKKKTHFDTNHHLTVKWKKDSPQDAAEELKATIRATLPSEARMTDD